MSRTLLATALAGLLLAAAGCGTDEPASDGAFDWPATSDPVDADGLVWASGSEVHLPDGSTIATGSLPAGSYVVAGPGVWFASAEPDELEGNALPELRLATADGVEDTGAHPAVGSLTATTDGRWLAYLDRLDGGSGPAEAVVVDLTSGEEVVRGQDGLVPESTEGADWTDLYEDAPVSILGVVGGAAYVQGLDTLVTWDLATGESTSAALDWDAIRETAWWQSIHRTTPVWNDGRTWRLDGGFEGTTLSSADGDVVTTSVPPVIGAPDVSGPPLQEWALGGWLDPTTVLAVTPSRDGQDVDWTTPALLTCVVPSGECSLLDGTEDGVNLPADRPYGLPRERSLDPS